MCISVAHYCGTTTCTVKQSAPHCSLNCFPHHNQISPSRCFGLCSFGDQWQVNSLSFKSLCPPGLCRIFDQFVEREHSSRKPTYRNLRHPPHPFIQVCKMGCGASNSNAVNNNAQSRPSRPANTTNVPVQRSAAIQHKPLIKAKNYRHGSNLTQVKPSILSFVIANHQHEERLFAIDSLFYSAILTHCHQLPNNTLTS